MRPEDGLPPIRDVIRELGLRPKRSLGQHFIHDLNFLRRIARVAGFPNGHEALEIGAGPGGPDPGPLPRRRAARGRHRAGSTLHAGAPRGRGPLARAAFSWWKATRWRLIPAPSSRRGPESSPTFPTTSPRLCSSAGSRRTRGRRGGHPRRSCCSGKWPSASSRRPPAAPTAAFPFSSAGGRRRESRCGFLRKCSRRGQRSTPASWSSRPATLRKAASRRDSSSASPPRHSAVGERCFEAAWLPWGRMGPGCCRAPGSTRRSAPTRPRPRSTARFARALAERETP